LQLIPATVPGYQISSLSDRAVMVSFGNILDEAINDIVLSLHKTLQLSPFPGYVESVPAYASMAVFYDIKKINTQGEVSPVSLVKNYLQQLLETPLQANTPLSSIKKIPVCYDELFGIDLKGIAELHQLSIDEIISLHTAVIYKVYMIGFLPGFAYMGTVDNKLITPRKDQPRLNVAAGSVGIAGAQTGIYPMDSPGGWQIIGKTPLHLFDITQSTPCLLSAGDRVQFISISLDEFNATHVH